jgi:hypothetical protein
MTTGLFHAHSGWRYIVILIGAIALIKALSGWLGKGRWSSLDDKLARFTPIVVDIQVLLGIVLWIVQQRWMGGDRVASWEHPFIGLVALVIGHITTARVRRAETDQAKFRTMAIGFLVAALLVAVSVAQITEVF